MGLEECYETVTRHNFVSIALIQSQDRDQSQEEVSLLMNQLWRLTTLDITLPLKEEFITNTSVRRIKVGS
jgi:hypothetical protein